VNLGIKQPVSAILDAAEEHRADLIGMSGLLVKSTVIMKENLEEMNSRGVSQRWPVILGGAALTRPYVEQDLAEIYEGEVRYARDAFEGLRLMDALMAARRGHTPSAAGIDGPDDTKLVEAEAQKLVERKARRERSRRIAESRRAAEALEEQDLPARSSVADRAADHLTGRAQCRQITWIEIAGPGAQLRRRAGSCERIATPTCVAERGAADRVEVVSGRHRSRGQVSSRGLRRQCCGTS